MKIIIAEGCRGTGKSTTVFGLRQLIEGSTSINFTGFKEAGIEGKRKVTEYYWNWLNMLQDMKGDYTFICDRFFFSEMVYSKLYKDYDFSDIYQGLCDALVESGHEIHIFFLRADGEAIEQRLMRDKTLLFDKVGENVDESLKQQAGYEKVLGEFSELYGLNSNVHYTEVNTTHLNPLQVRDVIMTLI